MPPPSWVSRQEVLHLKALNKSFFILKLTDRHKAPAWVLEQLAGDTSRFFSVTKTEDEISIVGEAFPDMPVDCRDNMTWRCIKINGPMEFGEFAILAVL